MRSRRDNPTREKRGASDESPRLGAIAKRVSVATGILSLAGILYGVTQFFYDSTQSQRRVTELMVAAKSQEARGEYSLAWSTLEQASAIDAGNKWSGSTATIHLVQEDLAMMWLENARLAEGESWVQFAGKLEPILDQGLATAQPQRRADIMAHLGWAAFLRSREGSVSISPDGFYHKALDSDAKNPFANAMLGHWMLWQKQNIGAAKSYFDAAVASGREQGYVRSLELAALRNANSNEADLETIRAANEMRKANEPIHEAENGYIWSIYSSFLRDETADRGTSRLMGVLPPDEHLATFRWLFDKASFSSGENVQRLLYLGMLQEGAGQSAEALATFRTARAIPQSRLLPSLEVERLDAAIKRLSKGVH